MKALWIAGLLVAMAGCAPATPTSAPTTPRLTGEASDAPSPTPADGPEALAADLTNKGTPAIVGSSFLAEPLPGEGILVCVGSEAVQVYVLKDHEAALAAAAMIDRSDPSKIGSSIVDWAGRPRFWLRDRMLVLYVGADAATDAALRDVLGQPFAEARDPGRPPLPAPDCA